MLETFTWETFSPLLQDTFRLSHDSAPDLDLPLELIEVNEVRDTGPQHPLGEQRRTPFALVFRGPPDIILRQATYRLKSCDVGNVRGVHRADWPGCSGRAVRGNLYLAGDRPAGESSPCGNKRRAPPS